MQERRSEEGKDKRQPRLKVDPPGLYHAMEREEFECSPGSSRSKNL